MPFGNLRRQARHRASPCCFFWERRVAISVANRRDELRETADSPGRSPSRRLGRDRAEGEGDSDGQRRDAVKSRHSSGEKSRSGCG
jgi:hypothetical protein